MEDIEAFVKAKENGENIYKMSNTSEAVAKRCSVKQMFLEILQNSLESICVRASFLSCRLTLTQVLPYQF